MILVGLRTIYSPLSPSHLTIPSMIGTILDKLGLGAWHTPKEAL